MNWQVLFLTTITFCLFQLSFAGEGFWETHGPYGGEIWEVEFGGGTRGLCYAAGEGGFYTSFDNGTTWEKRTPELIPEGDYGIHCHVFSMSQARPGLVYAAFSDYYQYEFFKSEDAGATWQLLEVPAETDVISAVACDPNDPDRVYVAYSEGGG